MWLRLLRDVLEVTYFINNKKAKRFERVEKKEKIILKNA